MSNLGLIKEVAEEELLRRLFFLLLLRAFNHTLIGIDIGSDGIGEGEGEGEGEGKKVKDCGTALLKGIDIGSDRLGEWGGEMGNSGGREEVGDGKGDSRVDIQVAKS